MKVSNVVVGRGRSLNKRLIRMAEQGKLRREDIMRINLHVARQSMIPYRVAAGFKAVPRPIVAQPTDNAKSAKAVTPQYTTSLAAERTSGRVNVCDYSTVGCRRDCLHKQGNGQYPSAQRGRRWKTWWLEHEPHHFLRVWFDELSRLPEGSLHRPNTYSDLAWERIAPWLFWHTPHLIHIDYTKHPDRDRAPMGNYFLAYSASERDTDQDLADRVSQGWNVAVVTNDARDTGWWNGGPAVDATLSDEWMLPWNNRGVYGLLKPIGMSADNPMIRGGCMV